MIAAINYADNNYKKQQKRNTLTAYSIGKVDKVYSFSPSDIEKDYYDLHKNILTQKRGGGCWLWKPYFILKVLNTLSEGDYLLYVDSGALYLKNARKLISKLEKSNQTIMLFETPLIECQWTQKRVFLELNAYQDEIKFSNQIMGGFILLKKTASTLEFVKKWLTLCQREDLMLTQNELQSEDSFYISHREDQSLLSVLAKKEGIIPFTDPSDYGKFPNQYLDRGRFFHIRKKDEAYKLKDAFFLLVRTTNPVFYWINFTLKSIINKAGFRKISI